MTHAAKSFSIPGLTAPVPALPAALALAAFFALPAAGAATAPGTFYVDYRARVPASLASAFPVAILHPDAVVDMAALRRAGTSTLAYVSVGEMAHDAPYRARATKDKLPLLGRNEAWKSDIIDLRDARWSDLLAGDIAGKAFEKGFDGLFLDTPDTLLAHAAADTPEGRGLRDALVAFVKRVKTEHPGKRVVLNRGFEIFDRLKGLADGVMAESVFAGFDPATGKFAPVAPAASKELLARLHELKDAGFAVYVLDYAARADVAGAYAAGEKIRAEGFSAMVSTPDLMGEVLAPWRETPRRVLALYNVAPGKEWPADTITADLSQMPLEWLGYEVDYRPVHARFSAPSPSDDRYAAVLIPRDFSVAKGDDKPVVDWLLAQKEGGAKLIFLGNPDAFTDAEERARLLRALGIAGTGNVLPTPATIKAFEKRAGMVDFEAPLTDAPQPVPDVLAPEGARVHLGYDIKTAGPGGKTSRITPIFTASWGGMALAPFINWQRPDFAEFWYLNPFAFFEESLGGAPIPAPDTTTRDGLRAFLSHIDGDGFANRSSVASDSFTGEVIRDRVLKKYHFPVSVSVIEAEVRCLAKNLNEKDSPRLEAAARSIFLMPNVEVASHSFSHPFYWIKDDPTASSYSEEMLSLKIPYELDLNREVGASIKYINEKLAPPGKPVNLFLWSGNCRPGPEALRLVREAGIESLNGGDTLISALNRTVGAAAARSLPWDDELQVLAPMQNENVYTHLFTGTVRGAFVRLLQTFALTENPRRLKPANLYYHFYSGDRQDSLKAIETVCDWAMKTPLHPVTVSGYAKSVRDANGVRLFRDASGGWLVSGSGAMRTVRLPVSAGVPDIAASSGVTGHVVKDDQRYIHLDGSPGAVVRLAPAPAAHAYVETSEADLSGLLLETRRVVFTTAGWKESRIVLAGLPPDSEGRLTLDGKAGQVRSDAAGRVVLQVAPGSRVEVDFRP